MSNRSKPKCIVCQQLIKGRRRVMRLQIISEEPKLISRARALGFVSRTWVSRDYMEATLDENCFNLATLIWQIAFHTRALSPRR